MYFRTSASSQNCMDLCMVISIRSYFLSIVSSNPVETYYMPSCENDWDVE